jgi:hypothetical protein
MYLFQAKLSSDMESRQFFPAFLTAVVLGSNIVYMVVAFRWWATLKLMDLENELAMAEGNHTIESRIVMWLQRCLPDWERQNQIDEIKAAEKLTNTEIHDVDFARLQRVKSVARKWVKKHRDRKEERETRRIEKRAAESVKKARVKIYGRESIAKTRLKERLKVRQKKSVDHLQKVLQHDQDEEMGQKMVVIVVKAGMPMTSLGFLLKMESDHTFVVKNAVDKASDAFAQGLRKKMVLLKIGEEDVSEGNKNAMTILRKAPRPVKLIFGKRISQAAARIATTFTHHQVDEV